MDQATRRNLGVRHASHDLVHILSRPANAVRFKGNLDEALAFIAAPVIALAPPTPAERLAKRLTGTGWSLQSDPEHRWTLCKLLDDTPHRIFSGSIESCQAFSAARIFNTREERRGITLGDY